MLKKHCSTVKTAEMGHSLNVYQLIYEQQCLWQGRWLSCGDSSFVKVFTHTHTYTQSLLACLAELVTSRFSKMASRVKVPVTKPDCLSSSPGLQQRNVRTDSCMWS